MQPFSLQRLARRAIGYSSVGMSTFALDLSIVAVAHHWFAMPFPAAVAIGFLVGISINYAICYHVIYHGTEQKFLLGFLFFVGIALIGVTLVTSAVVVLVERFGIALLLARVLVGAVTGSVNFLINTFFNFKML